jgi:hypothetical protein
MRANDLGAGWLEKSLDTNLGWFYFTLNLNFCAQTNAKKPLLFNWNLNTTAFGLINLQPVQRMG